MAYYTEDPRVTPAELSAAARISLEDRPENLLILEQWFPNRIGNTSKYTNDLGSDRDFTAAATHRAFGAPPKISGRPNRKRVSGDLPPVSEQKLLTEVEVKAIQEGALGTSSIDEIYDDADALTYAVRNREELNRSEILETGKIDINDENGLWLDEDFGRKASRTVSVGTDWSNVAAPALADEMTATKLIKTEKGVAPEFALMETSVIDALAVNTGYLEASRDVRVPTELSLDEINEIRGRRGLPMIMEYAAKVASPDGTVRTVLASGKVFHLPGRPVGATLWGRPVVAGESKIGIQSNTGGPVIFIDVSTSVPVTHKVVIDSIVMPVMTDPDLTGCLTVLGV